MGTFIVILLIWLTPGLLVFLYLFWLSKRARPARADVQPSIPAIIEEPKEEKPSVRSEVAKSH